MKIRCHVEQTSHGIMLSGIEMQANADSLRVFFIEKGISAVATSQHVLDSYQVFMPGMAIEVFERLIDGANIELV